MGDRRRNLFVGYPASRAMHGPQHAWTQAVVFLTAAFGFTATLIFNRIKRGLWLPGKDGKGAPSHAPWLVAFLIVVLAFFGLQPLLLPG
jgi:hypothetical protein